MFPKQLQCIIEQTNEHLNFPIDFISVAILHAAAAAIGNSVHLDWKWPEAAVLYTVLIGKPGVSKSHPINWAFKPLSAIDDQAFSHYEENLAAYKKAKLIKSQDPEIVEAPILRQFMVTDTTLEALNVALLNNKRSVAIVADELTGFLNSMAKNSQQYLSLWSRFPYIIDRKTSRRIRIKDPFVSIIGTMQSDIFSKVMEKKDRLTNGFLDRLLLVKPENLKPKKWKPKATESNAEQEWETIFNNLLRSLPLETDSKGNIQPHMISFTKAAEASVIDYQNARFEGDNNHTDDSTSGTKHSLGNSAEIDDESIARITQKLDTYLLRFCIVIQLLRWVCAEAERDAIDKETVTAAIAVTEFFKRNAFVVWHEISNKNALDKLSELQKKIYQNLTLTFTTAAGVNLATSYGMSERTFKNWIKTQSLFKRIGYGSYEKIYKG